MMSELFFFLPSFLSVLCPLFYVYPLFLPSIIYLLCLFHAFSCFLCSVYAGRPFSIFCLFWFISAVCLCLSSYYFNLTFCPAFFSDCCFSLSSLCIFSVLSVPFPSSLSSVCYFCSLSILSSFCLASLSSGYPIVVCLTSLFSVYPQCSVSILFVVYLLFCLCLSV